MNKRHNIYLIDLIGSYAGIDYYDFSFLNAFERTNLNVKILSNYCQEEGSKPYLSLMFGGQ